MAAVTNKKKAITVKPPECVGIFKDFERNCPIKNGITNAPTKRRTFSSPYFQSAEADAPSPRDV
jgi:hypothetical protein